MELIFITALTAALIYTGMWKVIMPLCLALYGAFVIARYREKRAAAAEKAGRTHAVTFTPAPRPGAIGTARPAH